MKEDINISIITITFNNFSELTKTLESIENLGCERIVINGGSCVKTKELLQTRNDIISISEKDKGISDAFNKGLNLATRRGIWILNSGDTCNDKNFVKFADEKLGNCDFLYSPILLDDPEKGTYILQPHPNLPLGLGMPYPHPGMIIHRKIFKEIGSFDLNFKIAMDYELVCRMKNQNYKGIFYENPTVVMDVFGVSKQKLWQGHLEAGRALKKSNLYTSNFIFYIYRGFKVLLKKILYSLKLQSMHEILKKITPSIWRKEN